MGRRLGQRLERLKRNSQEPVQQSPLVARAQRVC